ncbi:MAG: hypothetical protein HUJ67_00685 [Ruminiclostridium sp.]|nr:hypothetical protein [Ruminiclostridium sp.]
MRKTLVLPAVSVVGGLIGLAVRRVQLRTAFEPGTGLPISGAPATYGMWAVVILTAVALVILCRGKHRTFEACYTSAFRATGMVQLSALMAGAILMAVAGFLNMEYFLSAPVDFFTGRRTVSMVRVVLGVACLAAAVGIWLTAQRMRSGYQVRSVWVLMPGLAGCLWVMGNYQAWAQDPVMGGYVFFLLAVLSTIAAGYLLPAFAFGKGRVTASLVVCLLGPALCIMSLGDGRPLCDVSLLLATAFYLLAMGSALMTNDAKSVVPEGPAACGGGCESCPGCGPLPVNPTPEEPEV